MKIRIAGIAHYLPDRIVTNEEISQKYQKAGTPEQIFEKTGILERRYSDGLTTGDMATIAVRQLLEKTGTHPGAITAIFVGTLTQDRFFATDATDKSQFGELSTAHLVIQNLGLKHAMGADIINACPSFLTALHVGNCLASHNKKVIVVGADRMSKTLNAFDYKTGVLFGDGAAAVLLEVSDDQSSIVGTHQRTITENLNDVYYKSPFGVDGDWSDEKFEIEGQRVYKHGVSLTVQVIREYLAKASIWIFDFDYIVPHQANMRMLREIAAQLEFPIERMLTNLDKVGNTAGASVPLCLSQKIDEGIVSKGNRLLLVSFGAGYALSVADVIL